MCGIVGYVGPRTRRPVLLEGLQRLEYRGYDSAGIVVQRPRCASTRDRVAARVGARLAAVPSASRAPPASRTPAGRRTACRATERAPPPGRRGRIAVVHNGIIENADELRRAGGRGRRSSVRDRHRGARPPDRPPKEPTARGGGAPGAEARRGHVRPRRDRRRARTASSWPATAAPRARHRREGDVRRLRRGRAGAHTRQVCTSTTASWRRSSRRLPHVHLTRGLTSHQRVAHRGLGRRGHTTWAATTLHAQGDLGAGRGGGPGAARPDRRPVLHFAPGRARPGPRARPAGCAG